MSESMEYETFPNLDGIVSADDVSQKGGGKFAADYVNWARVCYYLRKHAPGWQPYTERTASNSMVHEAPDGTCYLLIGFTHKHHPSGETVPVPHAIMDHTMRAKKNPDARDISDAFVRGVAKAAALLFGLGWQLWSKDDPLEREEEPVKKVVAKKVVAKKVAAKAVDAFSSMAEASKALDKCDSVASVKEWGVRVKCSSLHGDQLADLRESRAMRLAAIEES